MRGNATTAQEAQGLAARRAGSGASARSGRALALGVVVAMLTIGSRGAAQEGASGVPRYRTVDVALGGGAEVLHWGRRDDDARLDLFVLAERNARIWIQNDDGFDAKPRVVRLPEDAAFVTVGDIAGEGRDRVIVAGPRGIHVDRAGEGDGERGATPFEKLLPAPRLGGRYPFPAPPRPLPVDFLLDLDGDGATELLIPVRRGFVLYGQGDGDRELVERLFLPVEDGVRIDSGGPTLRDPLRLDMNVPRLAVEDINGDGLKDVLLESDDGLSGFLHGKAGLPSTPTFGLDLARFAAEAERERAGGGGREEELFQLPAARIERDDIDGDGIDDYLVSAGRLLRVYYGSGDGVDFSRPHTLLKFSSELRGVRSFDFDRDGRRDLVAIRFELPSLPRLLAAYFVSTTLDFEVLGYRNERGRRFARLPTRSQTLRVTVPALRDVIKDASDIADRFLGQVERGARFALGDLDGDGHDDGVLLDDDHVLRLYRFAAGEARYEPWTLGDLLFDTERSDWELEALLERVAESAYARQREMLAGRSPAREVMLGEGYDLSELAIEVRDLDGDARGDIIVRWKADQLRILLSERGSE